MRLAGILQRENIAFADISRQTNWPCHLEDYSMRLCIPIGAIVLLLVSSMRGEVKQEPFGKTADGADVDLFTITNKSGASVKLMTLGASIVSIVVPDRSGKLDDIVLGYETFDGYSKRNPALGAVVG